MGIIYSSNSYDEKGKISSFFCALERIINSSYINEGEITTALYRHILRPFSRYLWIVLNLIYTMIFAILTYLSPITAFNYKLGKVSLKIPSNKIE